MATKGVKTGKVAQMTTVVGEHGRVSHPITQVKGVN